MWILIVIGCFYTFCVAVWVLDRIRKIPDEFEQRRQFERREKEAREREEQEKIRIGELEKKIQEREEALAQQIKKSEDLVIEARIAVEKIFKEKAQGFPWLPPTRTHPVTPPFKNAANVSPSPRPPTLRYGAV